MSFITSFNNNIGKRITDLGARLKYLLQFCTGNAKVISDCVINEDLQKGCDKALELLYEQFGKPCTVAKSYVELLRSTEV